MYGHTMEKGRTIILQVKHHIFIWKCENQNLQSVVDLPTSGSKKCFFFLKILAWKTYCTWNCEKKGMTLCTDTVCKGKYWNNINISEHLNIRWWSGVTVYIHYTVSLKCHFISLSLQHRLFICFANSVQFLL